MASLTEIAIVWLCKSLPSSPPPLPSWIIIEAGPVSRMYVRRTPMPVSRALGIRRLQQVD